MNSPKQSPHLSKKYKAKNTLYQNGIETLSKVATTLQGSIYKGRHILTNQQIIIKRANITLHEKKLAQYGAKLIPVEENILKESNILVYFQSFNSLPEGIVKIKGFYKDSKNYFLILDNAGFSVLDHVKTLHEEITAGKLTIQEYQKHVTILFQQMVKIVHWLHTVSCCCHLDISLENFLIKDCKIKNGKFIQHGIITIIDFGLAEYFSKGDFRCDKFVGKTIYQAPEVYNKKMFDARLADVWSLGVCWFIMMVGVLPWNKPDRSDLCYRNIINGHLDRMLKEQGRKHLVSKSFLDVIGHMLCLKKRRFGIEKIAKIILQ